MMLRALLLICAVCASRSRRGANNPDTSAPARSASSDSSAGDLPAVVQPGDRPARIRDRRSTAAQTPQVREERKPRKGRYTYKVVPNAALPAPRDVADAHCVALPAVQAKDSDSDIDTGSKSAPRKKRRTGKKASAASKVASRADDGEAVRADREVQKTSVISDERETAASSSATHSRAVQQALGALQTSILKQCMEETDMLAARLMLQSRSGPSAGTANAATSEPTNSNISSNNAAEEMRSVGDAGERWAGFEVVRDRFGSYYRVSGVDATQRALKGRTAGLPHIMDTAAHIGGGPDAAYVGPGAAWCVPVRQWLAAARQADAAAAVTGAHGLAHAVLATLVALRTRGVHLSPAFSIAERVFVDALSGRVVLLIDGALCSADSDAQTGGSLVGRTNGTGSEHIDTPRQQSPGSAQPNNTLHTAAAQGADINDQAEHAPARPRRRSASSVDSPGGVHTDDVDVVTTPRGSSVEVDLLGFSPMSTYSDVLCAAQPRGIDREVSLPLSDGGLIDAEYNAYASLADASIPSGRPAGARLAERALLRELWGAVRVFMCASLLGVYMVSAMESPAPETHAESLLQALLVASVDVAAVPLLPLLPLDSSAVLARRCPLVLSQVPLRLEYALFADAGAYGSFGLSEYGALLVARAEYAGDPRVACMSIQHALLSLPEVGPCMRPVVWLVGKRTLAVVLGTACRTLADAIANGSLAGRAVAAVSAVSLVLSHLGAHGGGPHGLLSAETVTCAEAPGGEPAVGLLPWAAGSAVPFRAARFDAFVPAHAQLWQGPSLFGGTTTGDSSALVVLIARLFSVPVIVLPAGAEVPRGCLRITFDDAACACLMFASAPSPVLVALLQAALAGPIAVLRAASDHVRGTPLLRTSVPFSVGPFLSLLGPPDRFFAVDRSGDPLPLLGRHAWRAYNRVNMSAVRVLPIWVADRSDSATGRRKTAKSDSAHEYATVDDALVERSVLRRIGRRKNIFLATGSFVERLATGSLVHLVYPPPGVALSALPAVRPPADFVAAMRAQLRGAISVLRAGGLAHGRVDADHVLVSRDASGLLFQLAGFERAATYSGHALAVHSRADEERLEELIGHLESQPAGPDGALDEFWAAHCVTTEPSGDPTAAVARITDEAQWLRTVRPRIAESRVSAAAVLVSEANISAQPAANDSVPSSAHYADGPLADASIRDFVFTADALKTTLRGQRDRASKATVVTERISATSVNDLAAYARALIRLRGADGVLSALRLHVGTSTEGRPSGTLVCAQPDAAPLSRLVKMRTTLTPRDIVRLAAGLARALAALHSALRRPIGAPLPTAYYAPGGGAMLSPAVAASPQPGATFLGDRAALADVLRSAAARAHNRDAHVEDAIALVQSADVALAEAAVRLEAML